MRGDRRFDFFRQTPINIYNKVTVVNQKLNKKTLSKGLLSTANTMTLVLKLALNNKRLSSNKDSNQNTEYCKCYVKVCIDVKGKNPKSQTGVGKKKALRVKYKKKFL